MVGWDLFDLLDGGGVCDFHLWAVVELDPSPHPHALAGEFAHIKSCRPEEFHILGRHRNREIRAVIGAEIDIGAVLWRKRHKRAENADPIFREKPV